PDSVSVLSSAAATPYLSPLSLHDALPISRAPGALGRRDARAVGAAAAVPAMMGAHARPHAAAGEAAGGPSRVVAIAGSLRRDSLNRRLIEAAADCAPEGIEVCVYRGLGELPPFNQDLETGAFAAGPVHELCEQVAAAQGLLIATPEYNHSVPGVLKNAIDCLSRPPAGAVLAGKAVAVGGASGGR